MRSRNYLMLEGTDAKIHLIQSVAEMERARSQGQLKTNSFLRVQNRSGRFIEIEDLGDAEGLLKDPRYLVRVAHDRNSSGPCKSLVAEIFENLAFGPGCALKNLAVYMFEGISSPASPSAAGKT